MVRQPKNNKAATLDDRFRFSDDSFPGPVGAWQSQLRQGISLNDGEPYLLRMFKKTGTPLDDDLSRLIARGLRRIRRVLSSRVSRELLVEVREIVEDRDELAVVMLDPGSPIAGSSRSLKAQQTLFLSTTGRKIFWRNITRIARALAACHDAGIVHGAVSLQTIFSHGNSREDYRLGGYEACVHIADGDLGSVGHPLRPAGAISFRQDWMDLGHAAASILGLTSEGGPSLLAIERRMLDRLANPPQFQLFDGGVVMRDLLDVSNELEHVGSSSDGEMVLYPSAQVLRSELAPLTSGSVPADDIDAVVRFVAEDLESPNVRADFKGRTVQLVTDLAVYTVKTFDNDQIGVLIAADKRRAGDQIYNAAESKHRLRLFRNRLGAEERVRKLGPGAISWAEADGQPSAETPRDVAVWYALIVLETFTWLREQFRFYPVEVLPSVRNEDPGLVWLVPRTEDARDERRDRMGLRPAEDALRRELRYEDDRIEWTLATSDRLSGGRERLPELRYLGDGSYGGRQAFAFTSNQVNIAGEGYYLRPRRDGGSERAIRRRLQNIVAARSNVELLRALDDPTQVVMDETLRDIAAPGIPPADMDETKRLAWQSIVTGRSINIVVGPPGVGKTYLISQLVKSILSLTPDARVLISAQNHETLVQMENELGKALDAEGKIVVRVERSGLEDKSSALRLASVALMRTASPDADQENLLAGQYNMIRQALAPVDAAEQIIADGVFRDTENLLLRSSDVTLATTSSYIIEEMIADGEQFDWVIVEEAARANGAELIGALLLGNRRVMIGDGSVAKIVKLEHAWRRLDGRNDDGFQVAPFPG